MWPQMGADETQIKGEASGLLLSPDLGLFSSGVFGLLKAAAPTSCSDG